LLAAETYVTRCNLRKQVPIAGNQRPPGGDTLPDARRHHMSPPSPARPVYLSTAGIETIFGLLHMPMDGPRRETAVLICPPFGWEESCSYRSRRDWAEHLARAGYPTLRIDLPSTGDSDGSPEDEGRLEAWTGAIRAASEWLSTTTDGRHVAAIGIGFGGLLACQAIADGAPIEELVLWAVPARGRTFVRELRAFGLMEGSRSTGDDGEPFELPDGWTGAGGFVLSAETTRALEGLDVAKLQIPDGQLHRALLLERDGIGIDERLRSRLEGSGVAVTVSPGNGYSKMMDVPHEAQSPTEVFAQTQAWLDEASATPSSRAGSLEASRARLSVPDHAVADHTVAELVIEGRTIRETPLRIEQPFGQMFGVLAEPAETAALGVSAVLLNAGAHRRIGQDRMWVELARRWAARGVVTLRLDLGGIGDADGDSAQFREVGNLNAPALVDQVLAALDALDARKLGPSYILAGLCSGAHWSFHAALRDKRVSAAFMLNPQSLFWDPSLDTARVLRRGSRTKVLRGEVPLAQIVALAQGLPSLIARRTRARWHAHRSGGDELDRALDRLRDADTHLRFMFSAREPLYEELELEGRMQRMDRWPNVGFDFIPGEDHLLRPLESQRLAHAALDQALERELRRIAEDSLPGPRNGVPGGAALLVKPSP
jgi:alpha-beta hydrolase superfamily lysophospholipase